MLSVLNTLTERLKVALEKAFPEAAAAARQLEATKLVGAEQQAGYGLLDPQLAPASKPEFGDFQANGALALARPLRQAPRAVAEAIVAQLADDPIVEALCLSPEIAGPGFINLSLRPEVLVG